MRYLLLPAVCLLITNLAPTYRAQAQYLIAGQRANASYVDIVPDRTVAAQRPGVFEVKDSLDLDADGRYDLRINPVVSAVNFPSFSESRLMPLHDDVSIYSSSQAPAIVRFASNDTIQLRIRQANPQSPPNVWGGRSTIYPYGSSWLTRAGNNPAGIQSFGYWLDGQDGYLGIRLRNGTAGAWRYGWIRIQAIGYSTSSATMVVKDYALTNNALSQRSASAAGWQVYPTNVTDHLIVEPPIPGRAGQLTVHDLCGRPVQQAALSGSRQQLNLAGLATGCYLLRIDTPAGYFTQRIVKQ